MVSMNHKILSYHSSAALESLKFVRSFADVDHWVSGWLFEGSLDVE